MLIPAGRASGVVVCASRCRFLAPRIVTRPSAAPYSRWVYNKRSSAAVYTAALRQLSRAVATRGVATSTVTTVTKTKVKKAPAKTTTRKTTAKKAAPKKKKKTKAAPKKAPKKKKAVKPAKPKTPEEEKKLQLKQLKKADLKEPAKLPESPWILFAAENLKGVKTAFSEQGSRLRALSEEFKNLSPSQISAYQETADKNKVANQANLKAWVESHTIQEISAANYARVRIATIKGIKLSRRIPDERRPKKPKNPWVCFIESRVPTHYASAGGPVRDQFKVLAEEWRGMSEEAREPFKKMAAEDHERYARETKAAMGRDIPVKV